MIKLKVFTVYRTHGGALQVRWESGFSNDDKASILEQLNLSFKAQGFKSDKCAHIRKGQIRLDYKGTGLCRECYYASLVKK